MNHNKSFRTRSIFFLLFTATTLILVGTISTIFSPSTIPKVLADSYIQQQDYIYDLAEDSAFSSDSSFPSYISSFKDPYIAEHEEKQPPVMSVQKIKCVNSNINVNDFNIDKLPPQIRGVDVINNKELQQQGSKISNDDQGHTTNTENGNIESFDGSFNIDNSIVELCINVNLNDQIVESAKEPILTDLDIVESNVPSDDNISSKPASEEVHVERIKINSDSITSNESLSSTGFIDSIMRTFQSDSDGGGDSSDGGGDSSDGGGDSSDGGGDSSDGGGDSSDGGGD
ncbi:MAG: hypothetical protein ACE5SW_11610, partial [Nitrososphaeraceae archaeon]